MKTENKIIFKVITCRRCKTVFQPETGDKFEIKFIDLIASETFIKCPKCAKYCKVTTNGAKFT